MLNQIVVVGRLVKDPEIIETDDGKNVSNITVATQRSYKNAEGVYETDFIDCTLWNGIAQSTKDYCKKGDILGIKGRLQTDIYEKDGEQKKVQRVIAEKVTFLSSKSKDNEREESQEELENSKENPVVDEKTVKTKKSKKQLEQEMA
ncbi:MAG: single-stranded DNA-binding protein [Oscillospiraceae bacterium]